MKAIRGVTNPNVGFACQVRRGLGDSLARMLQTVTLHLMLELLHQMCHAGCMAARVGMLAMTAACPTWPGRFQCLSGLDLMPRQTWLTGRTCQKVLMLLSYGTQQTYCCPAAASLAKAAGRCAAAGLAAAAAPGAGLQAATAAARAASGECCRALSAVKRLALQT